MISAPNRRWLRFTLRTLLVAVTLFACWLGYELNWIRQRHEVLSRPNVESYVAGINGVSLQQAFPPLSLRVLGERGCWLVYLAFVDDRRAERLTSYAQPEERSKLLNTDERLEVERVRRLFPEAVYVDGGIISRAESEAVVGTLPWIERSAHDRP